MSRAGLRLHGLLNRRVGIALLGTAGLIAAVIAANLLGIYLLGSLEHWARWLAQTSGYFLLWRLCLYTITAWGWRWMRRRLLRREPDRASRRRLVRTEIAGVVTIVTLECSLLLRDL
ncbi:hypothetical protein [Marinobacterium rhizophilum]|uniref:Uncharacterized protein n=1 Tax=Marinobacterium rhizophilum TaxID=420402 RepID=A0ABY5HN78_9GAMM|nr:hypothetical protein [Marinobacterium rhizophilum]UTW12351.1 hypothetical protein KDW95_01315 [Marinobacterium rhizophilum]